MAGKKRKSPRADRRAEDFRHPEAETPLRPEIGTQAQFRKKKPPVACGNEFPVVKNLKDAA